MIYRGGCLCGAVRFEALAPAANPHSCSCRMCQRHTGAPAAAWVEFPRAAVRWMGDGGAPSLWRSSEFSSRAFCRRCGSSLGAVDDAPIIAILVGVFDEPDRPEFAPTSHSFAESRPCWWTIDAEGAKSEN